MRLAQPKSVILSKKNSGNRRADLPFLGSEHTERQRILDKKPYGFWPAASHVTGDALFSGETLAPNLEAGTEVMGIGSAGEVTRLLGQIAEGNPEAKNKLFECVYEELHGMAKGRMGQERPGHTLGATGLVHEAFLRVQGEALQKNRRYFFAAAANAMYRILVDHARQSRKHHNKRIPLDVILDELEMSHHFKMLDLHEALENLKQYGERGNRQHEVVVQRFFGGLQWKEIAANLGVAVATVEKDWQAARAWLYARLKQETKHDG